MKIYVISDTHFGFREKDSEFENDCYIAFKQAIEDAMQNADIILMPGDIFDHEIPTHETYSKVFKLLSDYIGKQELTPSDRRKTLTKIPIVIIPGTHEYRGSNYKGPIDILEDSGYVYQIDNKSITFEKDGEIVNIFGMKGVPEKISKALLAKLDFKPKEGVNILMLHQSFKEFLPYDDEMIATLTLEDLPKGFDLYLNGHIHLSKIINLEDGNTFALPGSTITTQIKRMEIEKGKGYIIYDTVSKVAEFKKISVQRTYELAEIKITKDNSIEDINQSIINQIEKNTASITQFTIFDKIQYIKPVIKIKLKGELNPGIKKSDIKVPILEDKVITLDKNLNSVDLEDKIDATNLAKDRESIMKKSSELFKDNLIKSGFKSSFDFNILIDEIKMSDSEQIARKLTEKGI